VVGRLIQQQQVGLFEQQASKVRPALLRRSTGQGGVSSGKTCSEVLSRFVISVTAGGQNEPRSPYCGWSRGDPFSFSSQGGGQGL
jgi:hypothetical protein